MSNEFLKARITRDLIAAEDAMKALERTLEEAAKHVSVPEEHSILTRVRNARRTIGGVHVMLDRIHTRIFGYEGKPANKPMWRPGAEREQDRRAG